MLMHLKFLLQDCNQESFYFTLLVLEEKVNYAACYYYFSQGIMQSRSKISQRKELIEEGYLQENNPFLLFFSVAYYLGSDFRIRIHN